MDNQIRIRLQALIEQAKNEAALSFACGLLESDEDKKLFRKSIEPFINRGIDVNTAMAILTELANNAKEGDSESDS